MVIGNTTTNDFYPRPPRGGRHDITSNPYYFAIFLSTPSARRATPDRHPGCHDHCISIHALREEGDDELRLISGCRFLFLSTPSARRATRRPSRRTTASGNFYPRPPRGGRPVSVAMFKVRRIISIHALREEGDLDVSFVGLFEYDFYPRPPRGGRRDIQACKNSRHDNFYPRPPRGGRRKPKPQQHMEQIYFYPRPPRGGRPYNGSMFTKSFEISIHALREEGDFGCC